MGLFGCCGSLCRVRDEHHWTSAVWLSESRQCLPVAFWLQFLKRPHRAFLHAWWTLVLCKRGLAAAIYERNGRVNRNTEELDQEGAEGTDSGTADEWLSFCDSGFPSVVRVEDLGCIGIVVRSTQGGVEVAVPSGAATPGMPDAIGVELSLEPGSYSGASGDFATVNSGADGRLVGPPRAARGRYLWSLCGVRRQWAPPRAPRSAQAVLNPWRKCRVFCRERSKFKEADPSAEAAHAQESSTTRRQRLPGAHGGAAREAQWATLSARTSVKISYPVCERSSGPLAETSWTRSVRLGGWGTHFAERAGSIGSFSQRCYCLRTGSGAAWAAEHTSEASGARFTNLLPSHLSSCGPRSLVR